MTPDFKPDPKTIQWVLDNIDDIISKRINERKRRKMNATDELIAAVGRAIYGRFKKVQSDG